MAAGAAVSAVISEDDLDGEIERQARRLDRAGFENVKTRAVSDTRAEILFQYPAAGPGIRKRDAIPSDIHIHRTDGSVSTYTLRLPTMDTDTHSMFDAREKAIEARDTLPDHPLLGVRIETHAAGIDPHVTLKTNDAGLELDSVVDGIVETVDVGMI